MSGGNFKVKAIKNCKFLDGDMAFKKGKTYEYKDGKVITECGYESSYYENFKELLNHNEKYKDVLIEYKENDYNIGDKVKFKGDLVSGEHYGSITLLGEMKNIVIGITSTIIEISEDDNYKVEDGRGFWYSKEMFEKVGTIKTEEEESMNYKVGDKVIVKEGLLCGKNYDNTYFNSDMNRFIGKTLTISDVDTYYKSYSVEENGWNWSESMLKDVESDVVVNTNVINPKPDSKIVISFDRNETIATCNNKQAKALCNPTDAYDVLEGIKVSVSRVLNIPVNEKVVASKEKVRPIEDYSVKELLELLEKRVK